MPWLDGSDASFRSGRASVAGWHPPLVLAPESLIYVHRGICDPHRTESCSVLQQPEPPTMPCPVQLTRVLFRPPARSPTHPKEPGLAKALPSPLTPLLQPRRAPHPSQENFPAPDKPLNSFPGSRWPSPALPPNPKKITTSLSLYGGFPSEAVVSP